jgi:hypothetical protein
MSLDHKTRGEHNDRLVRTEEIILFWIGIGVSRIIATADEIRWRNPVNGFIDALQLILMQQHKPTLHVDL